MSQFVESIIRAIVDERKEVYNPVLLYGSRIRTVEALELLESEYRQKHPKAEIHHVYGDEFTLCTVQALRNGILEQYIKSVAECDLLIIEGVEHISEKMVSMIEFYGLFDELWERGKQIILTVAIPPKEMPGLDPRIRTQLEGGIIYNVDENTAEDI